MERGVPPVDAAARLAHADRIHPNGRGTRILVDADRPRVHVVGARRCPHQLRLEATHVAYDPISRDVTPAERIRSAGVIVGPAAFIASWGISGALTKGYSPIRDHISDLAAVGAPTRHLMNLGFLTFAVGVGLAAAPLRSLIGRPGAALLGANAALSVGIMLAPLGRSPDGDRAHAVVAGLGYLALAATAPAAVPALRSEHRALANASIAVGATSLACLGLSFVRPESGFWQRAGITATDAWLATMGLVALRRRDRR